MGMLGEIKDSVGCPGDMEAGVSTPVNLTVTVGKLRQLLPFSYTLTLKHIKANGESTVVDTKTGRMGLLMSGGNEATVAIGGNITPDSGSNKLELELVGSFIGLLNQSQDVAQCNITVA